MADHDHDHHDEHGSELSETQLRVRALETILTEKGYVDPAALDAIVETYETKIGPRNGAVVVAKAWTDPAFRQALLQRRHRRRSPRSATSARSAIIWSRSRTRRAPQHDRLHALLLLSVGGARPAAGLVQVRALPLARGQGSARRARRFRRRRCRRTPKSASGIRPPRRASSCCRCGRPAPRAGARSARRARHPRFDDRHRPARKPGGARRHERHPRHGRHGRLRPGRGRAERAAVPRAMGRPRARDAARAWATPAPGTSTIARYAAGDAAAARPISPSSYYQRWALGDGEEPGRARLSSTPDELEAGHALRPGKPLPRKLTPDDGASRR